MIYKFARVPTESMETLIPEGVPYSTIPTGEVVGDESVTRQKTLREFIFSHMTRDMEDGTTVFLLACRTHSTYRMKGVDENDIIDWLGFLAPYGITEADLLSLEEYKALFPIEDI